MISHIKFYSNRVSFLYGGVIVDQELKMEEGEQKCYIILPESEGAAIVNPSKKCITLTRYNARYDVKYTVYRPEAARKLNLPSWF